MSNYTLRKLIEQRDELDAQLNAMRADMREAKLAEVIATIEEFGFTAFELGLIKTQHIKPGRERPTFRPKLKVTLRPPLYRDPATGATWAGRGRPPAWLDGHRDDYLIRNATPQEE